MNRPELVLLHGFLGSASDWQPLIPLLPEVRCHALDLPGHAGQPSLARLTDFPAWLEAELAKRHIRHYYLLGYSLGGRLALQYAARGASGLTGLILEGAHPGLGSPAERQARSRQDAAWARRLTREPLPQVLADWYAQPVFADLDDAERHRLVSLRSQNQGRALARTLCACSLARQPDWRPWLAATALPLAYVCGQQDGKFTAIACQLAALCPTLETISIPGAGHNVHRAAPAALARRLSDWLVRAQIRKA